MTIVNFTPWSALVGGVMLGLASGLVLLLNGKIAGISGIVSRALSPVRGDTAWRVVFLVGMVLGGAATFALWPQSAAFQMQGSWLTILGAGFLVGLGTRLSGGCTSGHGVCGLGRGSLPSLVAVMTFMGAGFAVVYAARHVIGVGGAQ